MNNKLNPNKCTCGSNKDLIFYSTFITKQHDASVTVMQTIKGKHKIEMFGSYYCENLTSECPKCKIRVNLINNDDGYNISYNEDKIYDIIENLRSVF